MFGWDWGAHLPDAGIFRPVRLCKVNKGRIDSVRISQTHRDGRCILDFDAEYAADAREDCSIRIRVTAPGDEKEDTDFITDDQQFETILSPDGKGSIVIENPRLWWVNGLGAQPLYGVEAVLFCGGVQADSWTRRIGLRSMTMQREKEIGRAHV